MVVLDNLVDFFGKMGLDILGCEPGKLRECLNGTNVTPRLLTELRCIRIVKQRESEKARGDIGGQAAYLIWVGEYKSRFDRLFPNNNHNGYHGNSNPGNNGHINMTPEEIMNIIDNPTLSCIYCG